MTRPDPRTAYTERIARLDVRLAAGERLQGQDVPRVKALRTAGHHTTDLPENITPLAVPPTPPDPLSLVDAARPDLLQLDVHEASLVRNMHLVVRQVLSTLSNIWQKQGHDRTLPPDIREYLRRTTEEIQGFLAYEQPGQHHQD